MIYFASDLHLGTGDRDTVRRSEARFAAWLDEVSRDADEVWLLGDIFDFWFEYRRVVPRGFVRTLAKLSELGERGIRIRYFTGNHDMWVGDYFADECGMEVHTSPLVADIGGRRIFAAHGDNMCIEGQPMLKLINFIFRSKVARALFSWLVHPDLAMKFGHWWSGKSRKSHGGTFPPTLLDPLTAYADRAGREEGIDCCIFGHFHLADLRSVNDGRTEVLFLGDWSSDEASYGVLDDGGRLMLKTFRGL